MRSAFIALFCNKINKNNMRTIKGIYANYEIKDFVSRGINKEYLKILIGEENDTDIEKNQLKKMENLDNAKEYLLVNMITNIEVLKSGDKITEITEEVLNEIPDEDFEMVYDKITEYKEKIVPKV